MRDRIVDRLDPVEIGGVERVLPPGRVIVSLPSNRDSASITGSSAETARRPSAAQRISSRLLTVEFTSV